MLDWLLLLNLSRNAGSLTLLIDRHHTQLTDRQQQAPLPQRPQPPACVAFFHPTTKNPTAVLHATPTTPPPHTHNTNFSRSSSDGGRGAAVRGGLPAPAVRPHGAFFGRGFSPPAVVLLQSPGVGGIHLMGSRAIRYKPAVRPSIHDNNIRARARRCCSCARTRRLSTSRGTC